MNKKNKYNNKFLKKNERNSKKLTLEYIIEYIFKQAEIIKLNDIINELSLSFHKEKELKSKINIIEKFGILSHRYEDTYKIANPKISKYLYKYALLTIRKPLGENLYLVNISASDREDGYEKEVIINNLNKTHKNKILAQLKIKDNEIIAEPIFYLRNTISNSLPNSDNLIKGVFRVIKNQAYIIPITFRSRNNIILEKYPPNINDGSLIAATMGNKKVKIATFKYTISNNDIATSLSTLSLYQYDIAHVFSEKTLQEVSKLNYTPPLKDRLDIRNIPLVTIDDDDAKDFDDAIYAEPIEENGGYLLYVAIADVSYYVESNTNLDKEAFKRGNSVYLPGLVVPMLPKELSNGWCSLNPDEDRGCMLAKITINRNGIIESYSFHKAIMKSSARLTYQEVQKALDNKEISANIKPVLESTIKPVYEAFKLLNKARIKRQSLEIQSEEIKIILDKDNNLTDIVLRPHYISHKIVEEFMIAANVSAAKFINKYKANEKNLCIYRVHDKPNTEKFKDFIKILKSFHIPVPNIPKNILPIFFNNIISRYQNEYFFNSLNESILRCQAQAIYDNNNIGHFGLQLKEYCHFTSPIRRYSDLMVHRLIKSIIEDTEFPYNKTDVSEICKHISITERIAFMAENRAKDRILIKWLENQIGNKMEGYISTITHSGMFIHLLENKASGLLPMRNISKSYVIFDEKNHTIKDKISKKVYKLGDKITVKLVEADSIKGTLTFSLIDNTRLN